MAESIIPIEEWRAIPGYGGYEASSFGKIRSIDRFVTRTNSSGKVSLSFYKGKILKLSHDGSGYLRVSLGRINSVSVHSAVALAFYGQAPSDGHQVAHWDDDPYNNNAENLRWATRAENMRDIARISRSRASLFDIKGQSIRLLPNDVAEIKRFLKNAGRGEQTAVAKRFNVTQSHVSRIMSGKVWR